MPPTKVESETLLSSALFVRNFTAELDVMPLLAHGSNCVVFHTIGLLEATQWGATEGDIAKYTCLSLKTIRPALTLLLFNELIYEQGNVYRPNPKYLRFSKPRDELDGEKKFLPHDDVHNKDDLDKNSLNENHTFMERKALFEPWILGENLQRLSEKPIPLANCEAWCAWLVQVDRERWNNPEGYCFKHLSSDPNERPPYLKQAKVRARKFSIQGKFAEMEE